MKAAILGSGNIGTDLMVKMLRASSRLELAAMVGIDRASDGLARAERLGVLTSPGGIAALVELPVFDDIDIVFDATSAKAHLTHDDILRRRGKQIIDLTPAARGPYVVPAVNLPQVADAPNLNMITCGGQATVPIVAAVSRVAATPYAEIVSSIASQSAGPGTRANIDEFTETTARGLETLGGARKGKAIIVLNPADPPLVMRNTVFCLVEPADHTAIAESVHRMVAEVQTYVPGYRLKQPVQFDAVTPAHPARVAGVGTFTQGLKVSVLLEVEGAGQYLPKYAGNLDIMTSAALRTGERLAERQAARPVPA